MKSTLLLSVLLLLTLFSFAQSTQDIINSTASQRSKQWSEHDDHKVTFGIFAAYELYSSAEVNGNAAFTEGYTGGLKLGIPVFTSGDGTNMGNTDGDITISAGYTMWLGSITNNYPDWTTYTAMAGFRLGLSGILVIEPQVGYARGNYENSSFKLPAADVSGLALGAHFGLTVLKGLDLFGSINTVKTVKFGTPIGIGGGIDFHF